MGYCVQGQGCFPRTAPYAAQRIGFAKDVNGNGHVGRFEQLAAGQVMDGLYGNRNGNVEPWEIQRFNRAAIRNPLAVRSQVGAQLNEMLGRAPQGPYAAQRIGLAKDVNGNGRIGRGEHIAASRVMDKSYGNGDGQVQPWEVAGFNRAATRNPFAVRGQVGAELHRMRYNG